MLREIDKMFVNNVPIREITYQGQLVQWSTEVLFCPICPKKPLKGFESKISIFASAKKPIKVTCLPFEEDSVRYSFMFKYGDDLRQDNLVLQMFKMMDRIWAEEDLGIDMVTYDVMETGF